MLIYYTDCPMTIGLALDNCEDYHGRKPLWIPDVEDRGKWVADNCYFYLVFKDEEFLGWYAIHSDADDAYWIHFDTCSRNLIKVIQFCWIKVKELMQMHGVKTVKTRLHDPLLVKLATKLGFKKSSDEYVYNLDA